MVEFRQMRYFVTLGETLHFGQAAERLHITQPPLSRQIAALEAELGLKLLVRRPRSITLTEAGRIFLNDCRDVLSTINRACDNARKADRGELGELTVGFMMHAAHTIAAGMLGGFMQNFPDVAVRAREMFPMVLQGEVAAGRVDVGILFALKPSRGLSTRPVYSERLCCVLPAHHPLVERSVIDVADLKGQPLVATPGEVAPALREAIVDYCRRGGFSPVIGMEVQLQQTIVSMVGEGIGIALVPETLARLDLRGVVFRELEHAPSVDNVLVWKTSNPNPALRAFLALAENAWPEASARPLS